VKYCGLQSGFGALPSRALFNVVCGPVDLLHSTRTVESLEADGYEVVESRGSKVEGQSTHHAPRTTEVA
jgi:hypothetical protein